MKDYDLFRYNMIDCDLFDFKVLDLELNEITDLESLIGEDWVLKGTTGKLVGFLIGANHTIYVMDENNNIVECDPVRFEVRYIKTNEVMLDIQEKLKELSRNVTKENYEELLKATDEVKEYLKQLEEINSLRKKRSMSYIYKDEKMSSGKDYDKEFRYEPF